jgi:hypothetical protein
MLLSQSVRSSLYSLCGIYYSHSSFLVIIDNTLQNMIHRRSHTKRQLSLQIAIRKKEKIIKLQIISAALVLLENVILQVSVLSWVLSA